jgi:protein-disulfide isomerase
VWLPLRQLVETSQGKIRLVFKNFPLDFHTDSQLAHTAALAAGEQGRFWAMHDLIFTHQNTIQRRDLLNFAAQLKLDMTKFEKDLDNPGLKSKIENDRKEGERIGVNATPSFVVDGEVFSGFSTDQIHAAIVRKIAKGTTQAAKLPDGFPDLDLSFGAMDAAIKIQWYADLTSPLTARSAVTLQHFLAAHSGNVQVQFKNFPLPNHDDAMLVHEFALAAAAQGKFWLVEGLLLADPKQKDRRELENIATQAQIDQSKLWADVSSHKYQPLISRDLADATRVGVLGTPTFVVADKKLDGVDGLAQLK